jgi:hypothetical protein
MKPRRPHFTYLTTLKLDIGHSSLRFLAKKNPQKLWDTKGSCGLLCLFVITLLRALTIIGLMHEDV